MPDTTISQETKIPLPAGLESRGDRCCPVVLGNQGGLAIHGGLQCLEIPTNTNKHNQNKEIKEIDLHHFFNRKYDYLQEGPLHRGNRLFLQRPKDKVPIIKNHFNEMGINHKSRI